MMYGINSLKSFWYFVFHHRIKLLYLWATLATFIIGSFFLYLWFLQNETKYLGTEIEIIKNKQESQELTYENFLFADHLSYLQNLQINSLKTQIESELTKLQSEESSETLSKIDNIYSKYQEFLAKVDRNNSAGLDTTVSTNKLDDWGRKLLDQDYDNLTSEITSTNETLESEYSTHLASLQPVVTPTPAPTLTPTPTPAPAQGYSYQSVATSRGTFSVYLIKLPLAQVTVKTVTANNNNCTNNCPTKPLAEYVSENNGYAGINGTYFCPPDYSSCSGKTNSYDFAVFDSNQGKWLNERALNWDSTGLAIFNGSSFGFYQTAASFPLSSVTAGISNFPPLIVTNNQVTVNPSNLTSYQKDVRGPRGALGIDGTNIYLAIVVNATVIDSAHVMKALGTRNVLNLDGGGSSALYVGGQYKVGPGRSLPNAVVLVK